MPESANTFCMYVVHMYIVRTHRHTHRIPYFFAHAGEMRNIFSMHVEHNVSLAYSDTRHTFLACIWSPLVAPKT